MKSTDFQYEITLTEQIYQLSPYCQALNLQIGTDQHGNRLYCLPFAKQHIGNIFLPALHGGLIGGFLQSCINHYLIEQSKQKKSPHLIDFSIDYLRSGKAQNSYAQCQILHAGRRISHVTVIMWQEDADKPIAFGRGHLQTATSN